MGNTYEMIAKTLFGFEEVLEQELIKLGAHKVEVGTRMVSFEGDKAMMYKANLCCRSAIKILKPIFGFRMKNSDGLYKGISAVDWSQYFGLDQTFLIDATVHSEMFTNSEFVAQRAKDAIADQFREKYGTRPSVDKDNPDIKINVHIDREHCSLSLDSSGASLHHRGYRTATNIAPINEVLAAGMLLLSGWEGQSDFLDPMCGSGTIVAEAAMIAANMPANWHRKGFAFQKWSDWDQALYEQVRADAKNATRPFNFTIRGFDKAPSAVEKAIENIRNAQVSRYVRIDERDFFSSTKTTEGPLHMVFNPPYGERLDIEMETFYAQMGDTMKKNYPGTDAWFITANLEALKFVGLKPAKKIKLFNGALEARLVKYVMYEGSRRQKHQEGRLNKDEINGAIE